MSTLSCRYLLQNEYLLNKFRKIIFRRPGPPGWGGRKADDLAPKKYGCEIQRSENRINLEESSKEGYGSKRDILPMFLLLFLLMIYGAGISQSI
jgi:hypothetical protein